MRLRSKSELAALAALAYGPFLASSPGRVSADSRQDLYLDPGRFIGRALDLWDPHIGAGTVPHQNLGFLVPTAPWFWLFDLVGVPDWVAQRLWLGTLSLVAALGARWLFRMIGCNRAGALVGALVYVLTPYQLAFTARMSVLLLPWAALPWLVALTMRATRAGGWRDPALLALVLVAVGGVNASSLLLVGLGPLLWVVVDATRGGVAARTALAAAGRIGVLALATSAWWIVGLRLQGAYGMPVLQLTENVRTVAAVSDPADVLRGLGNWFFYGRDKVGYSLDQAADYAGDPLTVALSFLAPALGLAAAAAVRWAHRTYFVLLVVVGTVVAVGSWPPEASTPYGSLWDRFASTTSVGLALRNTPRAVPLVVLGLAGLLAAAVTALPVGVWRRLGFGAVAVAAVGGLLPVWQTGFLTAGMDRPEHLPRHWVEAIEAVDAGDHDTRVLEIPGSAFAAYEWGTTVEPITPGLTDRPYLAREVLPAGRPASALLLDALDRRLQLGTFEPASLPPVARLLGVGTVAFRGDLEQGGRFDTPPIASVWAALSDPPMGLRTAATFGRAATGVPAVALFDVDDPRSIVRAAPADGPVVIAGDADGIVDAAAAGLLDGRSLVLLSGGLDDAALSGALDAGAHLVVTDSNRRRIQTWFYSLRDTRGPTEQAGEVAEDPTGYDVRLSAFPERGDDDARSVVEQVGGSVTGTGGRGPERPEDRAAKAVDGDVATAWRVTGADPRGNTLMLRLPAPVQAGVLRLIPAASPAGARAVSQVEVRSDGGPPLVVDLDAAAPEPHDVRLPGTAIQELEIRITGIAEAQAPHPVDGPVGLAEVQLGTSRVDEVVRLPVELLRRADDARYGLDIVMTRLRRGLGEADRQDDETRIDRRFELHTGRSFTLRGVVRSPGPALPGDGTCREDLVTVDGSPVPVRVTGDGSSGGSVESCAPLVLRRGSHRVTTAAVTTGTNVAVDRLVLSSGPDGQPAALAPRGTRGSTAGARLAVEESVSDRVAMTVTTDGRPFWLTLAQSESSGWHLDVEGPASAGPRTLVDGYANGWLLTPEAPGALRVTLTWQPQRLVWWGVAASGIAALLCLAIVLRGRRQDGSSGVEIHRLPVLAGVERSAAGAATPARLGWALLPAGIGLAIAPPPIAAGVAALGVAVWWAPRMRALLVVAAPGALLVARAVERPNLAWVSVLVLLLVLTTDRPRPFSDEPPR